MMPKTHLVSFADGQFKRRTSGFIAEASNIDLFDSIRVYNLSSLPTDFRNQHGSYMVDTARGFGYYIWKPICIRECIRAVGPDDVVVWLDAGFTINVYGQDRMSDYLDIVRASSYRMLSFQNVHTEKRWTKMDLAKRLGVELNPCIMATSQLSSGFMLMQKTKSNLEVLDDWIKLATEEFYRFSDDSVSCLENDKSFIEHRHDQSISSLLRKMRGTEITHYEVQPYVSAFEGLKMTLPAWATRSRE